MSNIYTYTERERDKLCINTHIQAVVYVRRQLLTDGRENLFPVEACSAAVQFKNSCPS